MKWWGEIDKSTQEKSQHENFMPKSRKENFPMSLRKLFCDWYQHLRATCQIQHADRRKRKTKFSFYIIFSWNIHENHVPCSRWNVPFFPKLWVDTIFYRQLRRSVEGEHILSTQLKNIVFVRTIHSLRAVCTISKPRRRENSKLSPNERTEKTFPTLNEFRNYFLRFSFSLHSLSVVCEHFIDLEQPNDICCSSRHHSFPHSFHNF